METHLYTKLKGNKIKMLNTEEINCLNNIKTLTVTTKEMQYSREHVGKTIKGRFGHWQQN